MRNSAEVGYYHETESEVGQKGGDTMRHIFIPVILSFLLLAPLAGKAAPCNFYSKWWPICRDPASGPDIGTAEWRACRERGGCHYP